MVDPIVENIAIALGAITWGSFIAIGIFGKPWKFSPSIALGGGFVAAVFSMVLVLIINDSIAFVRENGFIAAGAFVFLLFILKDIIKAIFFGRA